MSPPASCCGTTPSFARMRPAKPPTRNFKPFMSSRLLISLRYQPPIWHARLHVPAFIVINEVVEQYHAAALELPGFLLTGVEAERQGRAESEGRVLTEIVIARGMTHLDRAVLHRVKHLQAGHDLAGREHLDVKL